MANFSIEEAKILLAPYHNDLYACLMKAWQRWVSEFAPLLPDTSPRARANMVYDLIIDEGRRRLSGQWGVKFVEGQSRYLLNVKDRLIVRFKKLDENLQTHNYPTLLSLQFDDQMDLPGSGFVSSLPRVTVGYRLKNFDTEIDPFVVYSVGKRVEGSYILQPERQANISGFPQATPPPMASPIQPSIKTTGKAGQKKTAAQFRKGSK